MSLDARCEVLGLTGEAHVVCRKFKFNFGKPTRKQKQKSRIELEEAKKTTNKLEWGRNYNISVEFSYNKGGYCRRIVFSLHFKSFAQLLMYDS
ncbi:MAG: hypothetical protein AABX01_01100 [Candidatus Micrarchaeota archaeon]